MWQFVFWFCIGAILYSYLAYPIILYLLARFRDSDGPNPGVGFENGSYPTLCLIVSAHNEEAILRKKIENSLELDYPSGRFRILVASDGSDDRTVSIAEDYRGRGVELLNSSQRLGKSAILNKAMSGVKEDIVVYTDANSLFARDALQKLVRHFTDPSIGCVVGKLRYMDRHTSVGKGEGVYWKYEGNLSVLESKLKSVLVANGSIFAIRRETFVELYPDIANDFQLPIEIASQGYGVIYEPEAVAHESCTVFWQEEFERKVRIVVRGLTGFVALRDKLSGFRGWQFFSHKLLRWAIGPLLFLTTLSNVMLMEGSTLYTTLFVMQALFYLAALRGWRLRRTGKPHPMFYLPFYFTMVNLAAVIAISKFVSGERKIVWEKAESARFEPIIVPSSNVVPHPGHVPIARADQLEPVRTREKIKN